MKLYQHNFDRVEDYLHHRAPYLLVKDVVSISGQEVITKAKITGDEFFIEGHFPGAPILPGAMMQEMTTQSAGILIAAKYNPMERYDTHDPFFNEYALGVLVKVKQARYRGFARPGDEIQITVRLNERVNQMFDFNATVSVGQQTIMRNSFQLTNIPSATLQGTESQTQP
jgi:3-hydroxyacyl-[acyl-carrier-protein] dehydratase